MFPHASQDAQDAFRAAPETDPLTSAARCAIQTMCGRGLSAREIRDALRKELSLEAPLTTIKRLRDAQRERARIWRRRPLRAEYEIVSFGSYRVMIHDGGALRAREMVVAAGVAADGAKEILGVYLCLADARLDWAAIADDLTSRGLRRARLPVCDVAPSQDILDAAGAMEAAGVVCGPRLLAHLLGCSQSHAKRILLGVDVQCAGAALAHPPALRRMAFQHGSLPALTSKLRRRSVKVRTRFSDEADALDHFGLILCALGDWRAPPNDTLAMRRERACAAPASARWIAAFYKTDVCPSRNRHSAVE